MAVQTLHGLVQEERRANLTGDVVPKRTDQAEIEALFAEVAATRMRLIKAYDNAQVGELLAEIYRYEDRIKALKRLQIPSHGRLAVRQPSPASCSKNNVVAT